MRLKSLEIKGFKSFADKTLINLDNQITGIVGPNGCGKSNIVDAIRWVIGEHKIKTLRSDNLEDLIFNGSKTRSGSGLAEVALTFENTRNLLPTEFNTVTISRKFYKNGESEYRLNDVTCRLKDITNLFLDTGVTSDSYSIIELGMVDDIIKDKENSRRRMLEQAAGISIYKTRKKEARLKLDATEQDLNRIEDLLFEIANNLRSLESQARKAERYHQIRKEYREASVEWVKASLQDFNSTYQHLNSQQQQELDKILSLEALISKEDAGIEQQKLELVQREEVLHQLQKAFNELTNKLRGLENEKNLSGQKIVHLQELLQNIRQTILEAEKQTEQLKKSTAEAEKKLQTEEDTLQRFRQKLDELRVNLDEKRQVYDEQKKRVDQERSAHQQLQVHQFEAEKKVAVAENNIQNLQRSLHHLEEENKRRQQEVNTLREQAAAYRQQLDAKQTELKDGLQRQEEATARLLESQAELEEVRVSLFEENRLFDARQNEYNLLKSLIDSLEGYPDSIKYLNRNPAWVQEAQLLSELFTVPEAYRTCIENYLDKYLNYYVVDHAEQAYHAIDLLQHDQKGKAGFFMLSELKDKTSDLPAPPNCIPALDVIQCEARYMPLYKHLLHQVYIADKVQEVQAGPAVILQKDGSAFKTSKRIVGGSVGLFEGNKIGRTQRLEKLKTEMDSLAASIQEFKKQIATIQDRIVGYNQEVRDDQIQRCRTEVNRLENQVVQTEHRIQHDEKQYLDNLGRMEALGGQLDETRHAIADTQQMHQQMKEQLQLAFGRLQQSQEAFSKAEAEYNKSNEEYNQQNILLARQQSRINEINQEKTIRAQQIEQLQHKIQESEKQYEETGKGLKETEQQLHTLNESHYATLQQREQDEKRLNETDQAFYVFRNHLNEQEQVLHKKRKEKEQAENQLTGIKDQLNDMKLQLASMKERLHVEFRIELDDVLKEPRQNEENLEVLQAEVDKLKKRIENLGEVNPMAVEAFREMKNRHDFIQEQKNDLVQAKDALLKTIEEVEATANQKFKDTFERVKENFIQVFHALFTEDDNCDMKLVDPDNPAETAIEIYAQPKGKKPSTITQLSGGEKTLTSAAFLFAIYLIKPAPFCVLDEVDAPLDDANVGKFTNMIRKFSDNSQFIIVTHNKQTMASVDVIYGVTMQEAGVSKLVPVDFRSLN